MKINPITGNYQKIMHSNNENKMQSFKGFFILSPEEKKREKNT